MVNIERLSKKPKEFKSLCGLTPQQFNKLYNEFEPHYELAEYKKRNYKGRKRVIGGGDKPRLSLKQRLFMILLYYRTYATQTFIGLIVGLDESNVGRHIKRLHPVLAQVFKVPQKKIHLSESEIWELIVDATEQSTQKRDGTGYSGKKNRQTIKTQLIVNNKGIIKSVSKSIAGNRHDKKLYENTHSYTSKDSTAVRVIKRADLGYVGTECDIPIKKQRGKPLMLHEKYYNKKHAQRRIIIEHTIAHIKKFKILSDRYRNKTTHYNLIFKNICGLRNFITATN